MNPRFKVSRAGIDLLKDFEGFRSESARLPDGRWTVGYGHTKSARPGVTISEADASALLQYDLIDVVGAVNDLVFTPITQNQFDSLVCFAFNVGVPAFRGSTVLRRINEGSMLQAAWSLEMWRKAEFEGQEFVVDALVRRRAAEKALFLTPADGWVAAPSPVLPPRIDDDVCRAIPREKPIDLKASLVGSTATVVREDPLAAEAAPIAPVLAVAAASAVVFAPEPAPAHEQILAAPLPHQMADATQALSARFEAMAPSIAAGAEARSDLDLPAPPEPVVEHAIAEPAPVEASEPMLFESASRTGTRTGARTRAGVRGSVPGPDLPRRTSRAGLRWRRGRTGQAGVRALSDPGLRRTGHFRRGGYLGVQRPLRRRDRQPDHCRRRLCPGRLRLRRLGGLLAAFQARRVGRIGASPFQKFRACRRAVVSGSHDPQPRPFF